MCCAKFTNATHSLSFSMLYIFPNIPATPPAIPIDPDFEVFF